MIDDTTERRARAIFQSFSKLYPWQGETWEGLALLAKDVFLDAARTVAESDKAAELKLIAREPTTLMLHRAGVSVPTDPRIVLKVVWDAAPWLPGEGK